MDSRTTLVHSTVATAVNAHHSRVLKDLLHGNMTLVWSDLAYTGSTQVIRRVARRTQDITRHLPLCHTGVRESGDGEAAVVTDLTETVARHFPRRTDQADSSSKTG